MIIVELSLVAEHDFTRMGATCPNCGSTNTHVVKVESGGVVVRTYFACSACGNVW